MRSKRYGFFVSVASIEFMRIAKYLWLGEKPQVLRCAQDDTNLIIVACRNKPQIIRFGQDIDTW